MLKNKDVLYYHKSKKLFTNTISIIHSKKQYFIMQYCIMFKSQIRQLNRNTLYINAKQKHQPKIEKKQANLVKLSDRKGKKRE